MDLISVILPVYNSEKFIESSIKSILEQTYSNFELIILDDGSTDTTATIIQTFDDRRIKFYQHENIGMAATLNRGIDLATGNFIARQDADDISYPERLSVQISQFKENPKLALLGTAARIVSEIGVDSGKRHRHPIGNNSLNFFLLFDNPFVHSSVMISKQCLDVIGKYNTQKPSLIQDFELWSRISSEYIISNIDEILLDYREVVTGISQEDIRSSMYQKKVADQSFENLVRIGVYKTSARLIADLFHRVPGIKPTFFQLVTIQIVLKNVISSIDKNWKKDNELKKIRRQVERRIIKHFLSMYYPRLENGYYFSRRLRAKWLRG